MNLSFTTFHRIVLLTIISTAFVAVTPFAAELEPKPDNPYFAKFEPLKAPSANGLYLHEGDRLAIIGDSITEQKMYSRIMETYLTVCVPELKITARQFGWSGETAEGFLRRMTNDCLRFQPTVATLCYGMNDHRYRAYTDEIGNWYSNNYSRRGSFTEKCRCPRRAGFGGQCRQGSPLGAGHQRAGGGFEPESLPPAQH